MTAGLLMLRAKELNISLEEFFALTEGEIYDMLTERANDSYEYPLAPIQADFDALKR